MLTCLLACVWIYSPFTLCYGVLRVPDEFLPAMLLECHSPCTHSLSSCISSVSKVNSTSSLESL
ncbi:hypothetical protein SLEP1_g22554 [Rubroshorea leprosula]|uniref:Secreted protein n=1 Tax=Rubroshorea leprosula TaxID=152421 RepID=A0AAV5J9I8_9ROSI|nr:hypothetical protein SLEP1_g22554 [Rubroshorea leprosula]